MLLIKKVFLSNRNVLEFLEQWLECLFEFVNIHVELRQINGKGEYAWLSRLETKFRQQHLRL